MANKTLNNAKKQKLDEFYTQLSDIEKELKNYKKQFKNKIVFCNCDDPEMSNFYYYFVSNFNEIGLKKLITTHFEIDKTSYKIEYSGGADVRGNKEMVIKRAIALSKKNPLKQNFEQGSQGDLFNVEPVRSYSGDFRSPECIKLLKESDIVVTNPPFSLFREYVEQLIEYKKKFLIIGNVNAISCKEIFKLIKQDKIWLGYNCVRHFKMPNGTMFESARSFWYTNLDSAKRHEDIILYRTFINNENKYPTYDNYDAINVDKAVDIPMDYAGLMGVPITFLDKYNPKQFKILGITSGRDEFEAFPIKRYINPKQINKNGTTTNGSKANTRATLLLSKKPNGIYYTADNVNGYLSILYARILIKNKRLGD